MRLFRDIPADRRRSIYLTGVCLSGIGVVLILSIGVTVAAHFTNMTALRSHAGSMTFRAIAGTLLASLGFGAMALAAHIPAMIGHGHDAEHDEMPRRSDRDRELLRRVGEDDVHLFDDRRRWPKLALPIRRTSTTALSAFAPDAMPVIGSQSSSPTERIVEVVKIRCRTCRKLSAEEANYCEHCGHAL